MEMLGGARLPVKTCSTAALTLAPFLYRHPHTNNEMEALQEEERLQIYQDIVKFDLLVLDS